MIDTPAIGRIVSVRLLSRRGDVIERPAIIVRTYQASDGRPEQFVNVQAFFDGDGGSHNDGMPKVKWFQTLPHDQDDVPSILPSWRWPKRV